MEAVSLLFDTHGELLLLLHVLDECGMDPAALMRRELIIVLAEHLELLHQSFIPKYSTASLMLWKRWP